MRRRRFRSRLFCGRAGVKTCSTGREGPWGMAMLTIKPYGEVILAGWTLVRARMEVCSRGTQCPGVSTLSAHKCHHPRPVFGSASVPGASSYRFPSRPGPRPRKGAASPHSSTSYPRFELGRSTHEITGDSNRLEQQQSPLRIHRHLQHYISSTSSSSTGCSGYTRQSWVESWSQIAASLLFPILNAISGTTGSFAASTEATPR